MEDDEEALDVYKPSLQVEEPNPDKEEPPSTEQCESVPELDDSQLVGGESPVTAKDDDLVAEDGSESPVTAKDDDLVAEEETPTAETEMEMETETEVAEGGRGGGGKRKRGRNNRVPAKAAPRKRVEEDVCFICFDGGDLVLCDRRGCPKAYHPACVNRDEAFFRAKGRWNCGWHLCSNCEKNAYYMCYTCTYSLCKGCIKDSAILCVRGNKGFCETCMKTVMLIEKNGQGNEEMAQVDFDDKSSWEYLFKDYWIDLKGKLSLTSDEIAQAKNPWKGSDVLAGKQESPDDLYDANNDGGSGSDSSSENLEASNSKKRKTRKRLKSLSKGGDSSSASVIVGAEVPSMPGSTEWASKELLEFVMHMKNGDKSVLSQFDVQALLLEYIKRNKLRDPRRKSQIICDSRFESLFGKPRVGHFEMLKLLESHFLIKEDSQADDLQGSVVDTEGSQLEADVNTDALMKAGRDRRRKTRRKGDERGPQSNLDDYAAIDIHNINLIFLRRTLMDNLIDDTEKFHEMVVGSFVRIRISGSSQKQDMYRLVQVVGTSKAAEPYKVGKRTTDFMLEIVNLNKSEIISIDIISNQEFTEDECKRLRQSIKCGLINRLTVGDLLEKAMALQAVRVNDWLETEIVRLSHLRDRASEKGRRKELRECVEKLQLLKTAEERQRRLEEIPEIHADPNMDPSYESEEDESETDDKRQENYMRPRDTSFSRRGREPISPRKGGSALNNSWSGTRKNSSKNWELSRNMSSKGFSNKGEDTTMAGEIMNENSWNQGRDRDTQQSKTTFNSDSETGVWNSHSVVRSESLSGVASETSAPPPTGVAQSAVKFGETEKMWYYKDPSGTVQGPFSMVQLRKWSNTGYFPADLRIWRSTEKQDDSILLTDVLAGKFQKELPSVDDSFSKEHGPHLSSTYSGKPYETPLQLGRESHSTLASSGQSTGESRKSQPEISSSKGWAAPSFEAPKFATEGWGSDYGSRNDLSNLPSPTPTQSIAGWTGGQASENKWSPASFPVQPAGSVLGSNPSPRGNGALQSPAAVTPESGRLTHSSASLSSIKPSGGVDGSIVPSASFSQQPSVPGNKEQNAMENLGVTAPPSMSNSGGQLMRGSGNDSSSSFTGLSPAPNAEKGIHLSSTNALKVPSQSTVPGESHRVQAGTQPLPAPDLVVASMNPGADTTNAGVSFPNLVQSVTSQNPPVDSHGWGSGSVPRPEMVASCPIPGSESQAWGNAPSQKPEPNTSIPVPAQQPAYVHWGNAPSSVHNSASSFSAGNPAGNLSTPGFSAFPLSDPWRPPIPGNQWESGSNIPPLAPPGLPWGMGVTENPSAAPNLRPENPNTGWAPMPGNTNMGWGGPAPGNTNMQWGTAGQGPASGNANPAVQGLAPGNTNMHWAVVGQGPAPGNANAAGQGPPPGNTNMHWGAAGQGPTPGNSNPTGQGPAPGNTNMYWGAVGQGPALGNVNPPVQGPAPGNTNMNWGAAVQGPGPVNANPGWVAPSGNPGMWGGDQKHNGDRFSGHRDRGSQGGDSGYGGGRPSWNRQSSFGSGGAGGSSRPLPKGVCVYHENGHCRKGASCNFLHP